MRIHLFVSVVLLALAPATAISGDGWPRDLCLDGGGVWRKRAEVEIENRGDREARGDPVAIPIGKGEGAIDLEGARAEEVRAVGARGTEVLFRIEAAGGRRIERGPIPAGSALLLPAECPARGKAACRVYWGNPLAWPVPDFLESRAGLQNGGVEDGEGEVPAGWTFDAPDASHRASWVAEGAHSGTRCLKTSVAEGAEPTWIAARQAGIRISGGRRHRMAAWVRAEGVKGSAGWYIHVGTAEKPMLISPMLDGGGGTYGWKLVTAEFVAPPEATVADLGTVLRGTGTAWFDDVELECLDAPDIAARAAKPETLEVAETGAGAPWLPAGAAPGGPGELRIPVKAANLSPDAAKDALIAIDLASLRPRERRLVDTGSFLAADGTRLLDARRAGDVLLIRADLPARTIRTLHLYLSSRPAGAGAERGDFEALLRSPANLVRDPSFEDDGDRPAAWAGGGPIAAIPGGAVKIAKPGLFGARCGEVSVPRGARLEWIGWRQDVPVHPGGTYLLGGWLKGEAIEGGTAQIHLHVLTRTGELCKGGQAMTSAGTPRSGTWDWALASGIFVAPADAAVFQIHLTMLASGTLRHDGLLLAEVAPGRAGPVEARAALADSGTAVAAWPVNPVVKVFREDPPPERAEPVRISLARNEKEPIQLVFRSNEDVSGAEVSVDAPEGPGGFHLPAPEVGIVGYVPIDHASSYYESKAAPWERKLPSGQGRSDGWPGFWPDPIIPRRSFDLAARMAQPVWITVEAPGGAPAGDYAGRVRLAARGKVLADVPFAVRVRGFAIPREGGMSAIYDVRQDGARWAVPGKSAAETRKDFLRFLAERRVTPDRIQPDPEIRFKDGKVVADFAEYDRAAEFHFGELKLSHTYTPFCFYLFGWGHPPDSRFGEAPYEGKYPYAGVDRRKLRPEYKRAYQACLSEYWRHMKEKGWEKRCVLYISDEPYDTQPAIRDQMIALCEMVHEVDVAIPIYSSTWHQVPAWDGSLDIWGIGHYGVVSLDTMAALRRAGKHIWFTTDGHMCIDTPYCAVERLLPHYCFLAGAEAYEFWGIDWLTYDPWRFGWHSFIFQSGEPGSSTWVRYPNGDGFLAYPGGPIGHAGAVTSVRLEMVREGMEDFEYLRLLRGLVERARAAGKDAAVGEKALAGAARLVEIPNAGGTYSTKTLPDPGKVLEVREAVAEAIEALSR